MAGPPDDIPASKLWLKLQEMPRPSRVVDFPRIGPDGSPVGSLAMWVLTQEEQMICSAAAEEFTRRVLKDGRKEELGYDAVYSNAACVEILYRACRDPEDIKRPAFPTPKAIRETLTADECGRLFEHYLTVQLEVGPIVAHMSPEEMNAWVARIAEGGSAFPFDLLSSDVQKTLVLFMARRLASSPMATSSAGSPPGEPPTNEEPSLPPES